LRKKVTRIWLFSSSAQVDFVKWLIRFAVIPYT